MEKFASLQPQVPQQSVAYEKHITKGQSMKFQHYCKQDTLKVTLLWMKNLSRKESAGREDQGGSFSLQKHNTHHDC